MASVADLVHQTSTTTGTGNLTLSSVNGKQTFNTAFGTGGTNVFFYFISNQGAAEYEYGTGHMFDATTLVRDTVLGGSNGTSAVTFSAGTKDVTNDIPASYQRRFLLEARRNRIVNSMGKFTQAGLASTADAAYSGFDQWYCLTQTNAITPSQLTDVEDGMPTMMRFTQANATAQRFGVAQPLESGFVRDMRGKNFVARARVRMSAATTLRYALVEWTGTDDSPTKDIVLDWTSATFTAGNFFITTTTTVAATGSTALSANTLTDILLTGSVSSSMNNLVLFLWTDSTQAQNVTLDVGKVGLYLDIDNAGVAPSWEQTEYETELYRCLRYYCKSFPTAVAPADGAGDPEHLAGFAYATDQAQIQRIFFPAEMRTAPSVSFYRSTEGATAGQWARYASGSGWQSVTTTVISNSGADVSSKSMCVQITLAAGFTAGSAYIGAGHWVASARL